jgi:allose kinase
MKRIIAADVGGTHVRVGVVDKDFALYDFEMIGTADMAKSGNFIDSFTSFLDSYSEGKGVDGFSVGFPSTIDKARRTLLSTPNIAGLNQVPIADILEQRLKKPICIEKDVNNLLLSDIERLSIDAGAVTLGFYIGTGLGNAIFLGDRPFHGAHGAAGELGHIPVHGKSEICNCGNIGCSENYASGKGLSRIRDEYFPETPLKDIFVKHGDENKITGFIEGLSQIIASEINILDPEFVIIGGGIAQMSGFPHKKLQNAIYEHARKPYPACGVIVYNSPGDQSSGVIGAGINGFRLLKNC